MKKSDRTVFRLPALEVRQGENRKLYSFAMDGKKLPEVVTVSRVKRNEEGEVLGYQRPEVISHIAEIRDYIESSDPMIPNAVVIAFDDRVRFLPDDEYQSASAVSRFGTLEIPVDSTLANEDKPGWIVDGQQRLAAIRDADVKKFPICVVGFIAADTVEQREQFILVNSTRPLPKGLIYELLPTTEALLPSPLRKRRFPSLLLGRLNYDSDSPLKGMIKTATNPDGVIKDNSILRMLANSLSDGVLYRFRDSETGGGDVETMLAILKNYWMAVSGVFSDAWGKPPRQSRLTHGVGVVSLGFLMDAIADRHRDQEIVSVELFRPDLEALEDCCRWTNGYWDFGPGSQRKWNEIQNTTKEINLLTNYLLVQYRARVWSRNRRVRE